jgi:glycosyltransferase involved in cell wall biosynthesis
LIKVLYIDGVGPFGGASRSLFEAVRALPPESVQPYFIAAQGTAQDFYRQIAKDTVLTRGLTRFDNTNYSHYRGVRWLVLLREIFHIPFMLSALARARRQWPDINLIHVNEITEIIPGLVAKRLFKVPMVIHVRSPQWTNRRAIRTRWIDSQLRSKADAVIAIDDMVGATLPDDIPVTVIHNSFTAKKAPQSDTAIVEKLNNLRPTSLKVGFVGNLHLFKGVRELIEAAGIVRRAGRDVEFVVVGGATSQGDGALAWLLNRLGLHQDVLGQVSEWIRSAGVIETFHLLGPTTDIQCVYERLDVICFPSHLDGPGRPVFEAAFSAVPSIVAASKTYPDTLVDGETGIAISTPDPQKLADAILHFADNRSEVARMGANARRLAEANFVPAVNSAQLLAVYESLLARRRDKAASEPTS